MLHKNGDFIFRAFVISNSCGWQKVAEIAHLSTIARLICRAAFCGIAWINFLRARLYAAGFKQPDWRYSSRPILSFQQWADVPRRSRDWRQIILMRFIVRCTLHLNSRLVGRGDLATGYRCSLGWLRPLGSCPAQRAVAQRLSALAHLRTKGTLPFVRSWRKPK